MSNFSIRVYLDYTTYPPKNPKILDLLKNGKIKFESLNQYLLDYILIHFDQMLTNEINTNPDVIRMPEFQEFLYSVVDYYHVKSESRKNINGMALGPNGEKQYDSTDPTTKYNPNIVDKITTAVNNDEINPKKYISDPSSISNIEDLLSYFKFFSPDDTGIINLITDFIIPMDDAWNNYLSAKANPRPTVMKNLYDKFHREFEEIRSITNDVIINGNYDTNCELIEQILKDSVNFLEDLSGTSYIEKNIIDATEDISAYYEKVSFKENDIKSALRPADGSVDLVPFNQIADDIKKSISSYSNMSSSNIIAEAYNRAPNKGATSINSLVYRLIKSLSRTKNVNSTKQIQKLMSTTIYEFQGDKLAEFLTEDKQKEISKEKDEQEQKYIDRITDLAWTEENAKTRLARYDKFYPKQPFLFGGKSPTNVGTGQKYKFDKKSTQKINITQSGGTAIDIKKLEDQQKISSDDYESFSNELKNLWTLIHKQNISYNENEKFYSIEYLNERNDFLIQMMNIILVYHFSINKNVGDQQKFFDQLDKKINKLKKNLTDMWDVTKSNIDSPTNNTIFNKLLGNATLTVSEIKDLVINAGLVPPSPIDIDNDITNNTTTAKLLSGLFGKYAPNINLIINNLSKIINQKKFDIETKTKTFNEMYERLYSFYSKMRTNSNDLQKAYRNTDWSATSMTTIEKFTGDVIEGNIKIGNNLITELIILIKNFNISVGYLDHIRTEIFKSKKRLNEFKTYMTELINEITSAQFSDQQKNILDQAYSSSFLEEAENINNKLKEIPNIFINNYAKPIANVVDNVIPHYIEKTNSDHLNDKIEKLNRAYFEYNILKDTIMRNNNSELQELEAKIQKTFNRSESNIST